MYYLKKGPDPGCKIVKLPKSDAKRNSHFEGALWDPTLIDWKLGAVNQDHTFREGWNIQ